MLKMYGNLSNNKTDFLASTRAARDQRQAEKVKSAAAIEIQSRVKGWLERIRMRKRICQQFDQVFADDEVEKPAKPALQLYHVAQRFLIFCQPKKDPERLERICRHILTSLDSESIKVSYISVSLNKDLAVAWIWHMKRILVLCSERLEKINLECSNAGKEVTTLLRMLVSLTATNTWAILKTKALQKLAPGMSKLCDNFMGHLVQNGLMIHMKKLLLRGLSSSRILLKKTSVTAAVTVSLRPVISADYSDKLVSAFLLNILSLPGLLSHLSVMAPESVMIQKHDLLGKAVNLLLSDQQLKIHFNALEGSYALCLTANLIHIVSLLSPEEFNKVEFLNLILVITRLLESCGQYVTAKQSNLSHWHPVLGWFSVHLDSYLQASMDLVRNQLSKLWAPNSLELFIKPLLELTAKIPDAPLPPVMTQPEMSPTESNSAKTFLKKALEKTKQATASTISSSSGGPYTKLGSPDCLKVAMVCNMYQNALKTLSELRLEILSGLSYKNLLLMPLWKLIQSVGPDCGLKAFLEHLSVNAKGTAPEFQILMLFCDCLAYVVTILDDIEMYEKQVPFAIGQYIQISTFLNTFLFKAVNSGLILDAKSPLFSSLHSLYSWFFTAETPEDLLPDRVIGWLRKSESVPS